MADISTPSDVRLICGMISADVRLLEEASAAMAGLFSGVDLSSETMNFDFTHYYDEQMGAPLLRRFVSFERPVKGDALVGAKLATNRLEQEFAGRLAGHGRPQRPINLDPGYVDQAKLVLASMKDFSHRIYIGSGVYAEVTLMYRKGWVAFPWTFPDYASGRYHPFLTQAREKLRQHLLGDAALPDADHAARKEGLL